MNVVVLPIREQVDVALVVEPLPELLDDQVGSAETEDALLEDGVLPFEVLDAPVDHRRQRHPDVRGRVEADGLGQRSPKCVPKGPVVLVRRLRAALASKQRILAVARGPRLRAETKEATLPCLLLFLRRWREAHAELAAPRLGVGDDLRVAGRRDGVRRRRRLAVRRFVVWLS